MKNERIRRIFYKTLHYSVTYEWVCIDDACVEMSSHRTTVMIALFIIVNIWRGTNLKSLLWESRIYNVSFLRSWRICIKGRLTFMYVFCNVRHKH